MKSILKKFLIILITFSVICSICTISKAVNETINVDTNLIQPRTTSDEENDPYGINPISEGDLDECYADPSKAEKELDWKATKTVEDMCRDSWNYIRKNIKGD